MPLTLLDLARKSRQAPSKKPLLKTLDNSNLWESYRPLVDKGYAQERKNAGRKRIDLLIIFKMLILKQLFNISDEEFKFKRTTGTTFRSLPG